MTKEKFIEVCEANDWRVIENGAGDFELEKYSPEGEDFTFAVYVNNENDADYWQEVFDYAENFDPADHAVMWYGQNRGEPFSLQILLDDANAIKEMLEQLWRALRDTDNKTEKKHVSGEEKYEEEARSITEAIKALAKDETALENFECYLSQHFEIWLSKFANTPSGMASELNSFAHINDHEEASA